MKRILIICSLLAVVYNASSQASFLKTISAINEELKEVELKKSTTQQSISADDKGTIIYKRTEQKNNGKSFEMEYNFSIHDINALSIRKFTERDLMYVALNTNGYNPFIKYSEGNDIVDYQNKMSIFAENAENAEKIVALLKEAVKQGKEIKQNKTYPSSYDACIQWLQNNVENCDAGRRQFNQKLDPVPDKVTAYKVSTVMSTNSTSTTYSYDINFADINPYSVMVDIKGDQLRIIGDVNSQYNYIKVEKHDKIYFASGFDLYFNKLETARDYQKVLQIFIPLAKEKYEKSLPTDKTVTTALKKVNERIGLIESGDNTYNQSFTNECISRFSQDIQGRTSSSDKYTLNLTDVSELLPPLKINSSYISVKIPVENGMKLIKQESDGQFNAYINDFNIYFDDIDKARESIILLESSIKYCKEHKPNKSVEGSLAQKEKWLIDHVVAIEQPRVQVEQKLQKTPDSKMFRYTVIESSEKFTNEYIYEFKWEDMWANNVEYNILPQSLGININTKNYAKVVNFSKNGEVQNYTNKIYIEFADVETCKQAYNVLRDIITLSQKK